MRQMLIQEDIKLVEDQIKSFETSTGCELLIVVAKESDPYPAAAIRFGIFAAFTASLSFSYYFEFHHSFIWPLSFLALTMAFSWLGDFSIFKKLTLSKKEISRETLEKAIEQFHLLGTSKATHGLTAMIFVSVLERVIHVLVDEKLKAELTQQEIDELVTIMKKHFQKGHMALGLVQSIQNLQEKILKDFGGKVSSNTTNDLKDTIQFI